MAYTKTQKINKICENRGFEGTAAEKLEFVTSLIPQVEEQRLAELSQLERRRDMILEKIANFPKSAKEELNRRATVALMEDERKIAEAQTLLENSGEL